MTLVIFLPVFVFLLGLVLFLAAPPTSPKLTRIGEILMFCGLLATLLLLPGRDSVLKL